MIVLFFILSFNLQRLFKPDYLSYANSQSLDGTTYSLIEYINKLNFSMCPDKKTLCKEMQTEF